MLGLHLGALGRVGTTRRATAPQPTDPVPASALAIDGFAVLIDGLHIFIV